MQTAKEMLAAQAEADEKAKAERAASWVEVARAPIERCMAEMRPIMFTQHVADGELPNGRPFHVSLNLMSGALVVVIEEDKDPEHPDPARTYLVSARKMVEAIVEKEFPG